MIVRDGGRKGTGVIACSAFAPGAFIFRRRHGRAVRNARMVSLTREERRHLCELDSARSAVLVGPSACLNHSCEPNAMRSGVKVFAWRRIRVGNEMTIDDRLNAFGGHRSRCRCGAAGCAGTIRGNFFSRSPATQRAHFAVCAGLPPS